MTENMKTTLKDIHVKAESHCSDNEHDNDHTTTIMIMQRERILLVE